jgi:tRNA-dihydrouridine synthase B
MRIGWDARSINAVEVARRVEEAGAALITVHGRTREQHYSGRADWDVIAAVARAVSVPVLGNGDITSPRDAEERLRTTGVAGLAIGRGALGNPWVFSRTLHYLETGEILPEPDARQRVEMALRHLDLMIAYKGEFLAVREMRKHAAWYLKGLYGAAEARAAINRAERPDEMRSLLLAFLERWEARGGGYEAPAEDDGMFAARDEMASECGEANLECRQALPE